MQNTNPLKKLVSLKQREKQTSQQEELRHFVTGLKYQQQEYLATL